MHLLDNERFCIEKMLGAGESLSEIGRILGRGLSTISEEVKENGGRGNYSALRAIRKAYWKQYRKKRDCNKVAMDNHLTKFVEKKLESGWSPEAISKRLKIQSGLKYASPKSIRKFVERRPGLERFLFWQRNDVRDGPKRKNKIYLTDPDRKFIELRPIEALYAYGHWEIDFIVSKYNSFVLLVCVEKYSKLIRIALLPNRDNVLVNRTIVYLLRGYRVESVTADNDIGFSKWKELELMIGAPIYFCHPYHSWEKGLVENCNRWLREFMPKKTDLSLLSSDEILWIENWFNNKARECLDGFTPHEKMSEAEFGMIVESLEVSFPILRIWG